MTVVSKRWYLNTIEYWKNMMEEYIKEEGSIPEECQIMAAEQIYEMTAANLDNQNKHLFENGEEEEILWKLGEILSYLDDKVILDPAIVKIKRKDAPCYRWVYLILKYRNRDLQFDFWEEEQELDGMKTEKKFVFGYHGISAGFLDKQTADVQFMDVVDNKLVIESSPCGL